MQQIFCPTCGTGLAPTAKFCGNCGNAVEVELPPPTASATAPVGLKTISNTPPATEPFATRTASNTQPVTEPIMKEAASATPNLKATSTERLDPSSPEAASAIKRYQGAYRIARLTDLAGHLLKAIAIFMAIGALVIFGFGIKADYVEKGFAAVIALFVAGMVFLVCFAIGLIVSAHAQSLKAHLDSAVNSSPFLTNEQRAKIMSL